MSWYPGGTNASHITRNPVAGRCFAAGHPARSSARRRHREVQGWHVLDREGRERTVFLPRRSGESRCGQAVDSGVPEREHAVLSRDGSTRRHRALQGWHVLDEQRAPGGVCTSRRRHPVAAGGNSGATGASGLKQKPVAVTSLTGAVRIRARRRGCRASAASPRCARRGISEFFRTRRGPASLHHGMAPVPARLASMNPEQRPAEPHERPASRARSPDRCPERIS
jgi:hypothetical protein